MDTHTPPSADDQTVEAYCWRRYGMENQRGYFVPALDTLWVTEVELTRLRAELDTERAKGERVFQAVVYAFEGRDVPEDLKTHGMVRRALKFRAAELANYTALLIDFRALGIELSQIIKGFKNEAMNGVICVPMDDENGFPQWDAEPNRHWCENCKRRWARLFQVADALAARLSREPHQ